MDLEKLIKQKGGCIQFLKFCIVGVSNTAIGLGTYYLFLWMGLHYIIANILSWIISVFNAFYWNNKYVFSSKSSWVQLLCRTYISYGASFVLGVVLIFILVEWIKISEVIAPLIILIVTIPLNFLMNKFWAFR